MPKSIGNQFQPILSAASLSEMSIKVRSWYNNTLQIEIRFGQMPVLGVDYGLVLARNRGRVSWIQFEGIQVASYRIEILAVLLSWLTLICRFYKFITEILKQDVKGDKNVTRRERTLVD